MNSKPRLKNASPKLRSRIREAATHEDWQKLITAAIDLAEKTSDPRLFGLRAALAQNRAEQFLRKQHIICPADLVREFPVPKT